MTMRGRVVAIVVVLAGSVLACTEEQRDDAAEVLVREVVVIAGEEEFSAEGFEVEGDLSCEATSTGGAERIDVSCTGISTGGEELAIQGESETGLAEGDNSVNGSFIGTADGEEVFNSGCLGDGC